MLFNWFDASDAAKLGVALADQFAPQTESAAAQHGKSAPSRGRGDGLQDLLERADREVRTLRLNFYKKAKFANAFKWRLLENGANGAQADELTQRLVLHLSLDPAGSGLDRNGGTAPIDQPPHAVNGKYLLTQGNKCIATGAYTEAIAAYLDLIQLEPRHAVAHNNLGAALCKLGRYKEAEGHFRQAIKAKPDFPDAYGNLGNLLRWWGVTTESETLLRRALKLNPRFVDARVNLGLTLAFMSRGREAKSHLEKALKVMPRNADALCGLAFVAKTEGRFDEAAAFFKRALEINPKMSSAWAAQVGLRKMTSADSAWLAGAEEVAKAGIAPLDEAELRFAMGKYCDDVGDFKRAFQNYKRGNDLLKPLAEPYDRVAHAEFIDDLTRLYTPQSVAQVDAGTSASAKPVFVVGMPRSGTSLTEQIVASHPSAKGVGELEFWRDAVRAHGAAVRQGTLGAATKKKLGEDYLRVLEKSSGDAMRIVDKAPVNSDHLGLIHSVFPNARIIYMQRDPIDTCLSCYFQQFSLAMGFTMDLSDLAHYYREHGRLMAHWRKVLPLGTILDVPYEELVGDQERWTRKILEFLGLEWDEHCLNFHETSRPVVTSSFWQVRQKVYKNSVLRWRNYEKFVGPLLSLRDAHR
jgi:tetratricopeptide (TPR) repeat protein